MKKAILIMTILFISATSYAQIKPQAKLNKETNLIETTYFHANGEVSQKGTFNLDKKLHGEWISFNKKGETISVGSYANGVKTGKSIAAVTNTKSTQGIVSRN